jgi:hypothetical protein
MNQSITSIHGSAPFTLMFARKLNPFNDFSVTTLTSPSAEEVEKRASFINDIVFPSVSEHVKNVVTKRNKNWNASKNIVPALPIGTVVMARIPGKRPKLKPPFVGPYRVIRRTRGGTYLLADANGVLTQEIR